MTRWKTLWETPTVRAAIMAICAVVTALTVCFPVLGVVEWVSLIPVAMILLERARAERFSFGRAYLSGFGFFWLYAAVIFHWFFYMYPLDFLGLSKGAAVVVVTVACFGLALLHAVVGAFVFPLFLLAARSGLVKRVPILMPFLAAALWCVAEWCTTLTWAGVPWSRLALGQMKALAIVQTASLFGSYFITFLIVAVNFLVAYTLCFKKHLAAAVAMALFSVNLLVGSVLLYTNQNDGEPLRVAAVQGNIASGDKWDDDKFIDTLQIYTRHSEQAAEEGARLIVWPESVIPYDVGTLPSVDSYLKTLSEHADAYLLVGGFRGKDGADYNAIYAYQPDGTLNEICYFKRRLVPFGEFLPMAGLVRAVIPPLAELNASGRNLEAGDDSNIIVTDVGKIGGLICFDSIYEELARDSVGDGAELLVLSTNDSWFADSAALSMHERQAALRAIENGRYVVRAANTGISSIIAPTGEILDSVGADEAGFAVADVYLRDNMTLYTRIGNLLIWLCIALLLVPTGYGIFKRMEQKNASKTIQDRKL